MQCKNCFIFFQVMLILLLIWSHGSSAKGVVKQWMPPWPNFLMMSMLLAHRFVIREYYFTGFIFWQCNYSRCWKRFDYPVSLAYLLYFVFILPLIGPGLSPHLCHAVLHAVLLFTQIHKMHTGKMFTKSTWQNAGAACDRLILHPDGVTHHLHW